MRYGVGIDTGGTYTDAVIFDLEKRDVLASHKSQTTKEDLTKGILNALDGLDLELVRKAEVICLSTTLATNACVEDRGARSKLIFIGVDPKAVAWAGAEAGLDDPELICYVSEGWQYAKDWEQFLDEHVEWLEDAQALGIVELNAQSNGAVYERAARDAILTRYQIPVICGYELSDEVNSIKRGASALLNGRLIPVLAEFLEAIHEAMRERKVLAPIAIMRSDGTLMSERFTGEHPVETILCGPAASVVGSSAVVQEENAVVVDMGGTTTDIALIKEQIPVRAHRGVRVGRWHTAVQGLLVHTLGLGGDSAVRYDRKRKELYLDSVRVMPLCAAAARWPQVTAKLKELQERYIKHTLPLYELFYLVKDVSEDPHYNETERAFCSMLKEGPLTFEEAASSMQADIYNFKMERLEKEGVVMRCGLTPTDIMHLKGDFTAFSSEASGLGAAFVAAGVGKTVEELCDWVYNEVKKKLYFYIAEMLLFEEKPQLRKKGLDPQTISMLEWSWELAMSGQTNMIGMQFHTPMTLIGVGAPIHIFLPDVAKALHTHCLIPQQANVVNAVGAVACNVSVASTVEILPDDGGFFIANQDGGVIIKELEDAVEYAWPIAESRAKEAAISRGACEPLIVRKKVKPVMAASGYGSEIFMRCEVTATVMGALKL